MDERNISLPRLFPIVGRTMWMLRRHPPGLNIIINVVMVREAARERIVTLETPAITIDLHASSRFYVYLTARRSARYEIKCE